MGILVEGVEVLLASRRRGVVFTRTAMLGRQNVFVGRSEMARLLARLGLQNESALFNCISRSGDYAEPLFRALGAEVVESFDASSYEGATIIHDMNLPVPGHLCDAFDVVYDGGTTEHIFNFPTALANLMRMARIGGHVMMTLPANNMMGHGMYQISPELFFRAFSKANGFQLKQALLCECRFIKRWYEAIDPEQVHGRGQVINRHAIHMYVEAVKLGPTPAQLAPIQQSDYAIQWSTGRENALKEHRLARLDPLGSTSFRHELLEAFPGLVRAAETIYGTHFCRYNSLGNTENYRRVSGPWKAGLEGT
jgi:hypothetical protein